MSLARILAGLGLLLQAACDRPGGCPAGQGVALSADAAERRIAAVLPKGWTVAARAKGAVPYGVVPGPGGPDAAAVLLTLVGPERVAISGYHCVRGAFCAEPIAAREAVEVWIVSAAFAESAGPPAMTTRGASLIASCRGRAIYGLASRYAGEAIDFDGGFTGSSTETSRMPPASGDLPVSWQTWRQDVGAVVR
ncbi:hypothetical protein [Methylobacterium sp. WL8]|uniref:hypothetical protein n=1 Tax=Methylobacterium sp. WL8 TaxID=2603899 RepID=UPI0011CA2844|nr:hypothetical protein [Methylobacterium sp. WL8]TXN79672.1 hypothetical protein FV234_19645 [Methylobacterium sp. WL8]